MELRSLYIEYHLCLNSIGISKFFMEFNLFSLIAISMNLLDQSVIIICGPVMEG